MQIFAARQYDCNGSINTGLCFKLGRLMADHFPKDTLPKDTLPKDILPNGHFAERHFVERTVWWTDFSPKRHFTETTEILGVVTRTDYDWLLNSSTVRYHILVGVKFTNNIFNRSLITWYFFFGGTWGIRASTCSRRSSLLGHMILEVKFAYIVFFIYTCLFTTRRQDTFLTNESRLLKFLYFRQVVVSAKCLFGEKSVHHTVRSTKCPSAKCPFGKVSFGKVSFGKVSFGKMSGYLWLLATVDSGVKMNYF